MKTCTICNHPQRSKIESGLDIGSLRDVARQYGVSKDALARHRRKCMAEDHIKAVALASDPVEVEASQTQGSESSPDTYQQLVRLKEDSLRIMYEAERVGNVQLQVLMMREVRSNIETMFKVYEAQKRLLHDSEGKDPFSASAIYHFLRDRYPQVLSELMSELKRLRYGTSA